jgi:co-chaperonin GroES (HSP10)
MNDLRSPSMESDKIVQEMMAKVNRPLFLKPDKIATQKFTPTGTKVVVQVIKQSGAMVGSQIALPDISAQNYQSPRCWVIAAGPDCKQVKAGQMVLVLANAQVYKIFFDDDELCLCDEGQVLGIVDDPSTTY